MSLVEVILRSVVLVLLVSYLVQQHRQRLLRRSKPEWSSSRIGTPIDATKLMPSLERVRQDYLLARQAPAHSRWHRDDFRDMVRHTVSHLAYFRDREAGHDPQEHAA